MQINNIYNEDCVSGMQKMKNEGLYVDLIVADPPYVISRDSGFSTMKDRKNSRTGVNFGKWDENFDNKAWITESYEILNKGGSLIVFNDFKKASEIIDIATKVGYIYKDTLIWKKTNPMPRNIERRYVPDVEMIIWFVKKGKWTFNRQNSKYETSVLTFPSESGGGFKRYHPTQKPVKLINYLIKIHSNSRDLILDPFMGSGTSAVSSIYCKRNFIGFEIDKDYCNISNERISNAKEENDEERVKNEEYETASTVGQISFELYRG